MNAEFSCFESAVLRERYYRAVHPCGLPIYVFPKKMSTTYAILGTHYGSVDNAWLDASGQAVQVPDGIAHFLEHKLFANEDGSDSFERFSDYGADANAYTDFNKTAYLFSCTDQLQSSLSELIDFVTHPYFTEESVARERGIIGQEIGMYDDSPVERCYYGMLEGMYAHHSIRRNICGSVASIGQITPQLLYDCYHSFYHPANMALVVCGDVTPEEVYRMADARLPKAGTPYVPPCRCQEGDREPREAYQSRVSAVMTVSKPLFNIGWKDVDIPEEPLARQRKDASMSILNEMLFSRAGELYQTLFENGWISPEMSYGYTVCESFAYNSLAGEADDPELVLRTVQEYLASVRERGLSREDFERGRRVMYAEFVKEFDSVEAIANNLLCAVFDGYDLLEYARLISSVTFEEVCALFASQLTEDTVTLSAVYPKDSPCDSAVQ